MILFLKKITGFLFFLASVAISIIAVIAVLGFIHPSFDVFNHLQPIIFVTTFACLILSPLFLQSKKWQALAITITATGFLSSAIIFVPEIVLGLQNKNYITKQHQPQYKLLTHNIFGRNFDMERIANAINKENPDIIVLQEYFQSQRNELHPLLIKNYPYFSVCTGGKRSNIALYSKLRFKRLSSTSCAENDAQRTSRIFAKFTSKEDKDFIIGTTHLDWPMQVSKLDDGQNLFEGLNLAFTRKTGQYKKLEQAINEISAPFIFAADFNSTSWSYALRDFASNNGMKLLTRGILTFPNRFHIIKWVDTIPLIPLDHIMVRGPVEVFEVKKGEPAGSDHNSVIISFSI